MTDGLEWGKILSKEIAMTDLVASSYPGLTYVFGDIHGRADLLLAMADRITAECAKLPGRCVFLGDYVDRGPRSREVVELLMEARKHGAATCLKGNHEDLMVQAWRQRSGWALDCWMGNGGEQTLRSYGWDGRNFEEGLDLVPQAHIDWMDALPTLARDDLRIYVHAGLMPGMDYADQDPETCMWIRDRFLRARASELPGHIVHGHTPYHGLKPKAENPELLEHRTNLDTGAFRSGVLTVGVFSPSSAQPVRLLQAVEVANGLTEIVETVLVANDDGASSSEAAA
jgi:serine/threonine protein phosphatase 1